MALRTELAGVIDRGDSVEPCPELAQELSAYVGAEIDQATCVQIEAHMATCARCAGACDALKRTVSLCRRLPGESVPSAVRAAVRGPRRDPRRDRGVAQPRPRNRLAPAARTLQRSS
jgi:anti-sigma factor RsiW